MASSFLKTGRAFAVPFVDGEFEASAVGDASATEEDATPESSGVPTASAGAGAGGGEEEVIWADFCSHAAKRSKTIAIGAIKGVFIRTT